MHFRTLLPLAGLLVSVSAPAQAQRGTLDVYQPAPTPLDDFALSRPNVLGHLRVGAQLQLDYALRPLVWEAVLGDSDTEQFSIVEHQLTGTADVSLGLGDRVLVYVGMPVVLAMKGAADGTVVAAGGTPTDSAGLGDAHLGARVRLLGDDDDRFSLGLQGTLTFPSGRGSYRGDANLSFRPTLLGEIRAGHDLRITLNVGALLREEQFQASNVFFSHELRLGAGLAVPVWRGDDPDTHLDVLAQLQAGTSFRDFFGRASSTSETTAGVRFHHASGLVVGAAAGPGMTRGFGSPDVRGLLTVGWAAPSEDEPPPNPCADTPEDMDGFQDDDGCLDPDNDGDGILDTADSCPNEPETRNGYQDDEGCPDEIPDTDGDGLRDDVDQCVNEPEDRDDFQDADGCPDPDNDADGVLDVDDRCVMEPGPADNRGCPDLDRDVDTVVDRRDNCPEVPGVVENFGCPVEQRQTVRIESDQIAILDTVYFRTDSDVILARSFAMLDNVAQVLNAHPEFANILVEGHTDSRGRREHNIDLSQRRAQSVVRYLGERGHVDPARLRSVGYGPDRPVVPGARTPADHARNRRVVFTIESDRVRTQESGPAADTIDR